MAFKMHLLLCQLCNRLNKAIVGKSELLFTSQSNDKDVWSQEANQKQIHEIFNRRTSNLSLAAEDFRVLAEGGSIWSMVYLGYAFTVGSGVSIDKIQAEEWYRRAFERGADRGLIGLGSLLHEAGRLTEAEKVFAIGVGKGLAAAEYRLARVCLQSPRKSANLLKAHCLLRQASQQSDLIAKRSLMLHLICGRFGLIRIPAGVWLLANLLQQTVSLMEHDPLLTRLGKHDELPLFPGMLARP